MKFRLGIFLTALLLCWSSAQAATYELEVDGLACPFCAYGIEKQLLALDGVKSVEVDLEEGAVVVRTANDATLERTQAEAAVEDAGFELKDFRRTDQDAEADSGP